LGTLVLGFLVGAVGLVAAPANLPKMRRSTNSCAETQKQASQSNSTIL
jgi:hypothetical protein